MDNLCPVCSQQLEWVGQYHCTACTQDYRNVGFCPQCAGELQKLQACGAANYFCNQCNELKSKSKIRFIFQPINQNSPQI
ncbi:DNA ligase [Vibrio sp. HDW18]|uniref:zinc ribbon domain-containing protein n=1 Tax=Vibrio sp. HDW18 TaxID=2714948 RepID=UPI00140D5D60|nr:zinc ribbon domain-containing protein [Vibrio sp. HDW18]QIL86019.1 DNA ligase [Vibrio sp. HDW18]